ncbi:14709_t:CDS:2 [Dentiscutata erythropus]|uniref:14709_t:CDS:1 n=1 Tax=Dentiscutata erythropus TaxID=1348616 RepID=A0A9N9DU94_9GLOM|nr:14709_t:CDS:2 [Dentiscutata erythropus]
MNIIEKATKFRGPVCFGRNRSEENALQTRSWKYDQRIVIQLTGTTELEGDTTNKIMGGNKCCTPETINDLLLFAK